MADFWARMTSDFMPHGFCLRWDGPLLAVFIAGNAGIALAYFLIPVALRIFIGKRRDLPYVYMFRMFIVFILSCGITHIIKIWTLYQPVYWIEAGADLWTALVSLATSAMLVPLIPKALSLRGPKELEDVNRQLVEANQKLQQSEELLQSKVEERTRDLDRALVEARLSEEQFRSLFDLMPQLSWTAKADGQIDFFNTETYEYTGKTPEEMLGWGWGTVHDPAVLPEVVTKWQHALATVTPFEMEFPLRGKDGEYRWFIARIKPMRDADGHLSRWVGIGTNIDEQKRGAELLEKRVRDRTAELQELNEKLSENESKLAVSNNDLQQFAYVASHDLQEPLRTIKSFSELLTTSTEGKLDCDSQTYLHVIVDSVGRMQQLVRDLLNYARVDSQGMPLVRTDINEAFADAVLSLDTAIKETEAEITVEEMPEVLGDKTQLAILFQNLLANAIKFRGPHQPKIHVGVKQAGSQWQFTVTDNGIGLNMEYAERIFIVFQRLHTRTKYSGTGIGLAVCKRIVERHGGIIGVESEEGNGSRFWFKLPVPPESDAESEGESDRSPAIKGGAV
ncbi:MAG: PAS domain S-box protein [Cyanobacteria bacterium REEB67]|nr:PAS domain S-box protein [Cyanobacteria bacterium REEB67]